MAKMTHEYLLESLRDMFVDLPEVATVDTLVKGIEGADHEVEWEDVRMACEELVEEGVLQHAGRKGYEATEYYMTENGVEVEE